MSNPLRDEWLHGPDADPDPVVAEAIALITEYQLGMLSDIERAIVERRLDTDPHFAEIATPILFAARVMRQSRPDSQPVRKPVPKALPQKRGWVRQYPTVWRIAAALLGAAVITQGATVAYASILRSRIPPLSVTFTNAPLPVVMAELRRRYHIDVQMCDVSRTQDRVTITLKDAPVQEVADSIGMQTKRGAHWYVPFGHWNDPYMLLFQPWPDLSQGWEHVLIQLARSYTTYGCHR
ncbi:MAG TPA: hypothetical protein VNU46_04405 [Gemmatimonadaceae bacterium]|jgi:anti-sigma-K factor RskA|nr:hypothetical protein [Gemmatimonadaceae bacterium]